MKSILLITVFSQLLNYYNGEIKPGPQEARTIVQHALDHPSSSYEEALAHYLSGVLHYADHQYASATLDYSICLEVLKDVDTADLFLEVNVRKNLGAIMDNLKDYQLAIQFYQDALPIAKTYQPKEEAIIHLNLGNSYRDLLQPDKMLEHYLASLHTFQDLGDDYYVSRTYRKLGQGFLIAKLYDTASYYLQKTVEYRNQVKNTSNIGVAYQLLGQIAYHKNNYKEAISYYQQALPLLADNEKYLVYLDMVETQLAAQDYPGAWQTIAQAKPLYLTADQRTERHDLLKFEAEYYQATSQTSLAMSTFKAYGEAIAGSRIMSKETIQTANQAYMHLLQDSFRKAREHERFREKLILWSSTIGSILLAALVAAMAIFRFQKKSRARKIASIRQDIAGSL